jgi:exopolysaccharide biosynthesis protein
MDKYKEKPAVIAKNNRLVFSMDGDYFLYRVSRSARVKSYSIGMVIRQGQLLFDKQPKSDRDIYPPLDMLALYPDGDMRVFVAGEVTAQELLDSGARDVLSFGPALIRDGVLKTDYLLRGTTLQPRAAIGMVEKGHYWALIVEGRIRESLGTNTLGTGEIMQALGCITAFNLDGGWSSAMVFMGKQLNQLDNSGVRDNAREQNEVMGIGHTDAY